MTIKKNTKNTAINWFEEVELNDTYLITGKVLKTIFKNDKVAKYSVEIARNTPNGKIARAWINVIDFNDNLEEGKVYDMACNIISEHYETKDKREVWTTSFVVNEVNEL